MGRAARLKSVLLATKLRQIRQALGLSQNELIVQMGCQEWLVREQVSKYERGTLEPPYPILLAYARVAHICTDLLLDDELTLPTKLPGRATHRAQRSR